MSKDSKAVTKADKEAIARAKAGVPRSLSIAERGICSSKDVRDMMSSLMSDVISGSLTPEVTNAACNACGKLIKVVELEQKWGREPRRETRQLDVAFEDAVEI